MLRQQLGLPQATPLPVTPPARVVEKASGTDDKKNVPELPPQQPKKSTADRTQPDAEKSAAEAHDPESGSPPDHYVLLGVPRFTDDAKKIQDALIKRNTQLRARDNSKLHRVANTLLDEVVAAGAVLKDPARKAVYDAELRQQLGLPQATPLVVTPPAQVIAPPPKFVTPPPKVVEEPIDTDNWIQKWFDQPVRNRQLKKQATDLNNGLILKLTGALMAVAMLIAVPALMWFMRNSKPVGVEDATVPSAGTSETRRPQLDPDWDPANVRKLATLSGHTAAILSVAFSPDGTRLASGSSDMTLKVWDATSGQELLTLKGHTDGVHCVAFSRDGQRLISASGDRTVKVWDARPWTPELRAEREALSLIHWLRAQGPAPTEWLDAIAADQTLTEPGRQRALQFAREWK